jgi:hypothetical protein
MINNQSARICARLISFGRSRAGRILNGVIISIILLVISGLITYINYLAFPLGYFPWFSSDDRIFAAIIWTIIYYAVGLIICTVCLVLSIVIRNTIVKIHEYMQTYIITNGQTTVITIPPNIPHDITMEGPSN